MGFTGALESLRMMRVLLLRMQTARAPGFNLATIRRPKI